MRKKIIMTMVLVGALGLSGLGFRGNSVKAVNAESKKVKTINDIKAKPFDQIVVNSELPADLTIKKGDHYAVKAYFKGHNYSLNYKNKNGTLNITSIKHAGEKGKNYEDVNYITITVPKKLFEKIEATTNFGDVKMNHVTAKNTKISTEGGDISLNSCSVSKCKIHRGGGDVQVKGWKDGNLNIEDGFGDVTVNCVNSGKSYNCNVSTTVGQNHISGKNNAKAKNNIKIVSGAGDNTITFGK